MRFASAPGESNPRTSSFGVAIAELDPSDGDGNRTRVVRSLKGRSPLTSRATPPNTSFDVHFEQLTELFTCSHHLKFTVQILHWSGFVFFKVSSVPPRRF